MPFGEEAQQPLGARLRDAAFGDEAGDEPRGRHVEGGVAAGRRLGRDADEARGAVLVLP
jgi:hypothetical protein